MFILGVTGSIGSGKSTACAYLKKYGFIIIDADSVTRNIYLKKEFITGLEILFKRKFRDKTGAFDKKQLSEFVFSDPENTKKINSYSHPLIILEIKRLIFEYEKAGVKNLALDVPLLYETGMDKMVDKVLVIDTPENLQKIRVKKRDGRFENEIDNIISSQMPLKIKKERADFVIINDKTEHELEKLIYEFTKNTDKYL